MDIKYLTWLDVKRKIRKETHYGKELPNGIVRIGCFSDALEIGILNEKQEQNAQKKLKEWFGDWYEEDNQVIKLDVGDADLPVEFFIEEILNDPSDQSIQPFWQEIAYLKEQNKDNENDNDDEKSPFFDLPEISQTNNLKIVAFYSFKGGVGRTLSLVAHILALLEQAKANNKSLNILVIDGDLEAPGITYWGRLEAQRTTISFLDFLEVYHYSPVDREDSLKFLAKEIKKSVRQEGKSNVYTLPACLNDDELLDIQILPEHLVKNIHEPWEFSNALFSIGNELNIDYIFIDLRSGLSEISSPILFDPRVQRFIVTTINQQSINGTSLVLKQLSYTAPSETEIKNSYYFDPVLLINFLTEELKKSTDFDEALSIFQGSYSKYKNDIETRLQIKETDFAQQLLYLNSWEDARNKLSGTTILKVAQQWAENELIEPQNNDLDQQNNSILSKIDQVNNLREICEQYEYAESGAGTGLLITESLKNLATTFQDDLPHVVVIGEKGSGKTFNYIQLSRFQYWHKFLEKVTQKLDEIDNNIYIYPLLQSRQIKENAKNILEEARDKVKQSLENNIFTNFSQSDCKDRIQKAFNQDWQEKELEEKWTQFWLKEIANSVGLILEENALYHINDINEYLKKKSSKIIFLFDGLEDIFKQVFDNQSQKIAIESLIDIPQRIAEIRNPHLGIIIFIRRDYVKYAITQNFYQFENLYKSYQLFWELNSFLRLAYWIFCQAKIPDFNESDINNFTKEELNKKLEKVWGEKLGMNNSSEASTTQWIFAALTDFNGKLQARDIVRLLFHAADKSMNNKDEVEFKRWTEHNNPNIRLLPPKAIRCAIEPCSIKKVEEAIEEYPQFKDWVDNLPDQKERKIHFTMEDLDKLNLDKITMKILEEIGVIYEDKTKDGIARYYIPEIFRTGLGFTLDKGARPRVLALKRKALGKNLF